MYFKLKEKQNLWSFELMNDDDDFKAFECVCFIFVFVCICVFECMTLTFGNMKYGLQIK